VSSRHKSFTQIFPANKNFSAHNSRLKFHAEVNHFLLIAQCDEIDTLCRRYVFHFPGGVLSWPAHIFSGGFVGGGTEIAVAAVPGLYWRNEYRLACYRLTTFRCSSMA